eukprot:s131_g28.t1
MLLSLGAPTHEFRAPHLSVYPKSEAMAEADTQRFATRLASLVDALDRQPAFRPTEGIASSDQEEEEAELEELEPGRVDDGVDAPERLASAAEDSDSEQEHEVKVPGKARAETTGFLTELLLQGRKQLAAPSRQKSDEHKEVATVTLKEASLDTLD